MSSARASAAGREPDLGRRSLGIAANSGAGKTVFAKGLIEVLGEDACTVVRLDDYHRFDRQQRGVHGCTPLNPECNDMARIRRDLTDLCAGNAVVEKPIYNHRDGTFVGTERVVPADYLFVEGLLTLQDREIRRLFSTTLFLDLDDSVRLRWKIRVDTEHRGYSEDQVIAEERRRAPDAKRFVTPQRDVADMVVRFEPTIPGAVEPSDMYDLTLRSVRPIPECISDNVPPRAVSQEAVGDPPRAVWQLRISGFMADQVKGQAGDSLAEALGLPPAALSTLGRVGSRISAPLALVEMVVLFDLLRDRRSTLTDGGRRH